MALDVESVWDDGVNGQEALSRSGRFETLTVLMRRRRWFRPALHVSD
jgi:hypothetical protein